MIWEWEEVERGGCDDAAVISASIPCMSTGNRLELWELVVDGVNTDDIWLFVTDDVFSSYSSTFVSSIMFENGETEGYTVIEFDDEVEEDEEDEDDDENEGFEEEEEDKENEEDEEDEGEDGKCWDEGKAVDEDDWSIIDWSLEVNAFIVDLSACLTCCDVTRACSSANSLGVVRVLIRLEASL